MNIKSNYNKIFLSIIINNFGDVLFDLFIIWRITQETEDIMGAVYMIGSSILFRSLLSMFVGVIVDRFNKKRLIIFSNISSTIIIILFALLFDYVKTNIIIGILFIMFNNINNEIFARSTMLMSSELFDKDVFIKFQAKYSIINRITVIVGSSIVGFLISLISDRFIFLIDIATFIISAVLISVVDYNDRVNLLSEKTIEGEFTRLKKDFSFMIKEVKSSRFIVKFIIIMFILNLVYGYIPYILPVKISSDKISSILLGLLKSSIAVGEILGLSLVYLWGQKVSLLFKTSMVGNAIIMGILCYFKSIILIIICFLMYGLFDSITQPLFSYTISSIDEKNRGKILGGIDALILLSPSIGMYFIAKIMALYEPAGYISIIIIFAIAYLIVSFSVELNNIDLTKE